MKKQTINDGYLLFETLHFVLYSWSSYFALFLSYVNITKLLKFTIGHLKSLLSKLIWSLADIALHICYVKYEEAEVDRSAIIQDFRDTEKNN